MIECCAVCFTQKLRDLGLIGRNFLQLNVLFETMFPYVMIDKPALTIDGLFAQLGGVLSLWLGITIMTAIELVEFLYTLWVQWRNARKTIELPQSGSFGQIALSATK